ncbi:MAG: bifunctional methionine sulfoxide reductase B/A protein [Planctomycetes bacterium]|nr:bifunctional methionine sulfoxide reductase B/A protein [Planctomycetota bacterium]
MPVYNVRAILFAAVLLGAAGAAPGCEGEVRARTRYPAAPAEPAAKGPQTASQPLSASAGAGAPAGAVAETPRTPTQPQGESVETKTNPRYSKSGYDITPLPRARVEELAKALDPEAFRITQRADTERPFCGTLLDNKKEGAYLCVVCGLPLFSSEHKFNSGTGWPSFHTPVDQGHVGERADTSHGMSRAEIFCARCDAHLGHVFPDGPPPSGRRFCLNSASLRFAFRGAPLPAESRPVETETAYFAGGCFWGIEHFFQRGPGVVDAVSGYMQGRTERPSYQEVCGHATGHAETVKVVFDPRRITYHRLLEAFFVMHDPTQLNRQGPDVGDQYRSGVYFANERQQGEAEAFIRELARKKEYAGRKIVTEVQAAQTFWPAEEYHQDYIEKTGRACHVADPW